VLINPSSVTLVMLLEKPWLALIDHIDQNRNILQVPNRLRIVLNIYALKILLRLAISFGRAGMEAVSKAEKTLLMTDCRF